MQRRVDAVELIDFGIARSARATLNGARLTLTGAILGSPHYMAPEQIRGHHDPRTDVYGIGATLFEGLAGRPPFLGEDATASGAARRHGGAWRPRSRCCATICRPGSTRSSAACWRRR